MRVIVGLSLIVAELVAPLLRQLSSRFGRVNKLDYFLAAS